MSSSSTGVWLDAAAAATELDPIVDVGMSHAGKMGYWELYVVLLIVACILNLLVMIVVFQLTKKTASDIFACALCFSCFVFAGSCGTQCFINMVLGHFGFGRPACYAEALAHMITIETMFIILSFMAYDSYRTVAFGNSIGVKNACWVVLGAWIFAALGMGLFSLISPIYMAPAGVFCFFEFSSPVLYAFCLPSFVIASNVMAFFYYKIFKITRAAMARMGEFVSNQEQRKRVQMRLAQKLFLFVLVFVVCWTVVLVGMILLLSTGNMNRLDAVGGIFASLHCLLVPFAYGVINPRLRTHLLSLVTCGRLGHQSRSTPKAAELQSTTDPSAELSQQQPQKNFGKSVTTPRKPSTLAGGALPIHPSSASIASTTTAPMSSTPKKAEDDGRQTQPQPSAACELNHPPLASLEPPAPADSGQVTLEIISQDSGLPLATQIQSSVSDASVPVNSASTPLAQPSNPESPAVIIHVEASSATPTL